MMEKKIIVVVFAILSTAIADPKFFSSEARYGNNNIAIEDMEIDEEEQYAIVSVTPISGGIIPTVNFHDFITQYLAIRDDKRERCFIFRTPKTLEEIMVTFKQSVERNGFLDISQRYICTSKKFVPNDEISERFGDRIADFCKDLDVIQSDKKVMRKTRRSVKFLTENTLDCGWCVFSNCGN